MSFPISRHECLWIEGKTDSPEVISDLSPVSQHDDSAGRQTEKIFNVVLALKGEKILLNCTFLFATVHIRLENLTVWGYLDNHPSTHNRILPTRHAVYVRRKMLLMGQSLRELIQVSFLWSSRTHAFFCSLPSSTRLLKCVAASVDTTTIHPLRFPP